MVGFVGPGLPELRLLAGQVPLIFWDQGDTRTLGPLTIECGGTQVAAPILTLSAPLEGGGVRMILAFTAADALAQDIVVKQRDGTLVCSVDATQPELVHTGSSFVEPATLLSCLSGTGRVRVIRFLLQTCRTAFGLSADGIYVDNIRRLVDELSLRPGALEPLCLLDKKFILAAGDLPAPVGGSPVAVTIGSDAVQETPLAPMIERSRTSKNNRQILMLPVHRAAMSELSRVVVLGASGVAIRTIKPAGHSLEAAVSWMVNQKRLAPSSRTYALQCLTQLGQTDPSARDAVREVLLTSQNAGGNFSGGIKKLVKINRAIGVADRLFVSGFITDPHDLVQSINIAVGDWSAKIDRAAIQTFSTLRSNTKSGVSETVTGFVALAGGKCPVPQFGTAQFSLILRSRASVNIAQVPLLLAGVEARDAILGSVPATGVADTVLMETLLPAVDLAQAAAEDLKAAPATPIEIGIPAETGPVSLIMPFDSDLGMTKLWSAALGGGILCDAGVELVVVAPTDRDVAVAERVLNALYQHYGIASRLVSAANAMGARGCFAAGADAATRDHLLFLDGGCFPADKDSLTLLTAALSDPQNQGPVAGAVLDPAGTIRRFNFTPPQGEALGNPYEGFPAPQLDGLTDPSVFACSSSFLAIGRSVYEAIGGFCGAFLTRDWTDADFCLKARAQGYDVRLENRARAICYGGLMREGEAVHALSSRLDFRRFSRDWQSEKSGWAGSDCDDALSRLDDNQPSSNANVGNPRWAA